MQNIKVKPPIVFIHNIFTQIFFILLETIAVSSHLRSVRMC